MSEPAAIDTPPAGEGRRYIAIAQTLKDQILAGDYAIGARLPPERELSDHFAASRQTVRAALRLLREERLVTSRQGAGTIVAPQRSLEAFRLAANSIDDLVAYAAHMYTEIRSTGMERIEGRAAARLGVVPGHEWFVIRGLVRYHRRQTPVCWSQYYINGAFAGIGRMLPRNSGPIFLLLEEMFGITIAEMDQTISTAALSRTLAEELKAKPGETSIEVRRSYRTSQGQLAQISLHSHPAARFQQTIRMQRLAG